MTIVIAGPAKIGSQNRATYHPGCSTGNRGVLCSL